MAKLINSIHFEQVRLEYRKIGNPWIRSLILIDALTQRDLKRKEHKKV